MSKNLISRLWHSKQVSSADAAWSSAGTTPAVPRAKARKGDAFRKAPAVGKPTQAASGYDRLPKSADLKTRLELERGPHPDWKILGHVVRSMSTQYKDVLKKLDSVHEQTNDSVRVGKLIHLEASIKKYIANSRTGHKRKMNEFLVKVEIERRRLTTENVADASATGKKFVAETSVTKVPPGDNYAGDSIAEFICKTANAKLKKQDNPENSETRATPASRMEDVGGYQIPKQSSADIARLNLEVGGSAAPLHRNIGRPQEGVTEVAQKKQILDAIFTLAGEDHAATTAIASVLTQALPLFAPAWAAKGIDLLKNHEVFHFRKTFEVNVQNSDGSPEPIDAKACFGGTRMPMRLDKDADGNYRISLRGTVVMVPKFPNDQPPQGIVQGHRVHIDYSFTLDAKAASEERVKLVDDDVSIHVGVEGDGYAARPHGDEQAGVPAPIRRITASDEASGVAGASPGSGKGKAKIESPAAPRIERGEPSKRGEAVLAQEYRDALDQHRAADRKAAWETVVRYGQEKDFQYLRPQ